MATHSSVLAWRIPGTGEPGGLLSMGSHSQTRLKRLSSSSSSVKAKLFCKSSGLGEGNSEKLYWNCLLQKILKNRSHNKNCQSSVLANSLNFFERCTRPGISITLLL